MFENLIISHHNGTCIHHIMYTTRIQCIQYMYTMCFMYTLYIHYTYNEYNVYTVYNRSIDGYNVVPMYKICEPQLFTVHSITVS